MKWVYSSQPYYLHHSININTSYQQINKKISIKSGRKSSVRQQLHVTTFYSAESAYSLGDTADLAKPGLHCTSLFASDPWTLHDGPNMRLKLAVLSHVNCKHIT